MDLSEAITDIAALSAFGKAAQLNRLLRLTFPFNDGPKMGVLLVNTLHAREELSRDFRIELELLSDNVFISLKSMMAKMVTVSLVRADGSLRYFNGYVNEFHFIKTDGGFAFYKMVLGPWLTFAKLHEDCVSFHYKSVIELTEATFEHYLERDYRTRLDDADPKLSCANQYNETDYNHLHRRWEALGLHYWYEHRADGHTLWLADNTAFAPWIDSDTEGGVGEIVFRSESGAQEGDGIREWQPARRIGSGSLTLTSFDYKQPRPQRRIGYSANRQGDVFAYERFRNTGSFGYRDREGGEALATRGIESLDSMTQFFHAKGNDRNAQAGRSFKLSGHFSADPPRMALANRDYVILAIDHHASNNYQAGRGATSHYDNEIACIRQSVRWRPELGHNSEKRADPGVQTAIVVGPSGQDIHTDSLGRVKLQFHWDRVGAYDEQSSPWVRVSMPVAGGQYGQIGLPRVGQEVVVQFLDGNVDRPLITGLVYNSEQLPPWQLPGQSALSGLRSRELGAGGRGNHLVLDDTAGALQAQLKSDHAHSQLSLGRITRVEDNAGRKDERGEGWELATNAWGVARAGQGMLITTEARTNARSHIKDMGETVHRLNAARQEQESLATLAQQNGAQEQANHQGDVAKEIKAQNIAINGSGNATKKGSFPGLQEPHLVLASPAGIATSTVESTHIASGAHTVVTTGKSVSIAAGESLFASVRQTFRLFVHRAGMKLVAAAGDIDINALSNSINLLAKLDITHTGNRITIAAKEEIVINGAGSYGKFNASGIELGTRGNFQVHAEIHHFESGHALQLPITDIRKADISEENPSQLDEIDYKFDQHFIVTNDQTGQPLEHVHYKISLSDGRFYEGVTDEKGQTEIVYGRSPLEANIEVFL